MFNINCHGKMKLFEGPAVMGILNITPDSFYEGHLSDSADAIADRAGQMLDEGADILDIGGQSTRPGSERLGADEELARIMPALQSIRARFPGALISVDTYHSEVARVAVEAGADIINDISFGEMDPAMIATVSALRVPYIGMHMKGRPENMQDHAAYDDVSAEVLDYLVRRTEYCQRSGINDLIIDPGFGFGKTIGHNFALLNNLASLKILGKPVLVGLSRKSSIYKTLGIGPGESLNGTTVMHTLALLHGADILRVHDVREAVQVIRLMDSYKKAAR